MRYFNLFVLAVFLVLTFFAVCDSWRLLQIPIVCDYFYNPMLRMYEPVQISPDLGWWEYALLPFNAALYPFTGAPLWYQLLYFPAALWVVLVYILPYVLTSSGVKGVK